MNTYAVKWGTLDEKSYGRDRTPDEAVNGLGAAISAFILIRIGIVFTIGQYDPAETALTAFSWVYPLKLMAWQLTLDYFFYCYHRLTHDNAWLWSIHCQCPFPFLSFFSSNKLTLIPMYSYPSSNETSFPHPSDSSGYASRMSRSGITPPCHGVVNPNELSPTIPHDALRRIH